jgi:hypothetical protein
MRTVPDEVASIGSGIPVSQPAIPTATLADDPTSAAASAAGTRSRRFRRVASCFAAMLGFGARAIDEHLCRVACTRALVSRGAECHLTSEKLATRPGRRDLIR